MTSLKDDILAPVRDKLLRENQHLLVNLPQDLEARLFRMGGRAESAAAAGAKLHFTPAVPAAIVAGIVRYLGGPRADEK